MTFVYNREWCNSDPLMGTLANFCLIIASKKIAKFCVESVFFSIFTLLHSERPKLYAILVFLSAVGLRGLNLSCSVFLVKKRLLAN